MKQTKLITVALFVTILVLTQFAVVSAAPSLDEADSISGEVYSVTPMPETNTGVIIYEITLIDGNGEYRAVRVEEQTAYDLGLLDYNDDGNLVVIDPELWPESVTVPLSEILPEEEEVHHPVGSALATFFSNLPGVDYDTIMTAHENGYGFGVIAQALWLTQKMEGDSDVLAAILVAKKTGDFSAFTLEDGTVPESWGQLRRAILAGDKKNNLGVVISGKAKDMGNSGNGNGNAGASGNAGDHDNNKDKNKVNHGNNGSNGNQGKNENNRKNKP